MPLTWTLNWNNGAYATDFCLHCIWTHSDCRVTAQRLHDQQIVHTSTGVKSSLADLYSTLQVPKPDPGPDCNAGIGVCQALNVHMAACVGIMQRLCELNNQNPGNHVQRQQLSVEVGLASHVLLHLQHHCRHISTIEQAHGHHIWYVTRYLLPLVVSRIDNC